MSRNGLCSESKIKAVATFKATAGHFLDIKIIVK